MKQKLIVQSQGSPNDPAYVEQMLMLDGEQVPFHEFFHRQGAKTLKQDLVNSCHGNTGLTLSLVYDIGGKIDDIVEGDIGGLTEQGHRVVAIEQGSLYFAKPSLEAANMPTVPVVSIPLKKGLGGLAAFLAPYVPPGTAAIAGVSIGNYQTAANFAAGVLNHEFNGVYLINPSDKLETTLENLKVPNLGKANLFGENVLVLGRVPFEYDPSKGAFAVIDRGQSKRGGRCFGVFAPVEQPIGDPEKDFKLAYALHKYCSTLRRSVMVNRDENLAFFAAKVMASYKPEIAEALRAASDKKADSYDKRTITIDSFTGGE